MNWTLHCGDALSVLKTMPDASVDCIVTSPPYWGLRDYGHAEQIGLEPTHQHYVSALASLFSEGLLMRVLKSTGVAWVNLGDAYAGSWGAQSRPDGKPMDLIEGGDMLSARQIQSHPRGANTGSLKRTPGVKAKDLIGLPWHVAFAIQARGWYLRSDVIWSKPNPMPESVQDRPTKAHEYVFLFTKSPRYYYDAAAIREKYSPSTVQQFDRAYTGEATKNYAANGVQNPSAIKKRITDKQRGHTRRHAGFNDRWDSMERTEQMNGGANARTVWSIATEPSPYDHFAVMPRALARRCIVAGCPHGGVVLDPFAGVSTTGVVALQEGRSFVGIELNPKYHAIGRERLENVAPLLCAEVASK